jgi:hypothetical protein
MFIGAAGAFKLKNASVGAVIVIAAGLIDLGFSYFRKGVEKIPGTSAKEKTKNWFNG